MANRFEQLVQGAMKQMRDLPASAKYDLTLRIYDLIQYQDHTFARRYIELVKQLYRQDSADRNYDATHALITNLAKLMLIKDEPYVAYLLTRYEKKQRDIVKFGLDVANGDRIIYRHNTSPEFNIGKWRIRIKLKSRDWQLNIARRMKWWRKLPGWHKREVSFREWYIRLLGRINLNTDEGYMTAVRVLRCAEDVKGYREVRYPTQDKAKQDVEALLNTPPAKAAEPQSSRLDALQPAHA